MFRSNRAYLFITVFIAGMTTLAVEFTTSRMLQTVYGTSNIVWANVIGLVLLFLTLGYFIGGRLADRYPQLYVFYKLITLAGYCCVFFLLLTSVLLRQAAAALAAVNAGAVISSLVGVTLALAVPVTLLGCVSPFAVRLAVDDVGEAGRVSGHVYALSTLGSLAGTYLPVLITIPLAGTRLTATFFGGLLLLVGIVGLRRFRPKSAQKAALLALLLIPVILLWTRGSLTGRSNLLYETESAYNTVQVAERDGCKLLLLNEGAGIHSIACNEGLRPDATVWSMMLIAPLLTEKPQPERVAVIGLAGGTIAALFSEVFGPVPIDGIELDPAVVTAGKRYFELNRPNLNLIIGDGRYQLNQRDTLYDVITIDAYKVPYIPWHMATREFFEEVKVHLTTNGVVAINVGRTETDRRLVDAFAHTMNTVFPSVHTVDVPDTWNTILYATMQPTNGTLSSIDNHAEVLQHAQSAYATGKTTVGNSTIIFTDERAPVEAIVDSLVIRHLLSEGITGLPNYSTK